MKTRTLVIFSSISLAVAVCGFLTGCGGGGTGTTTPLDPTQQQQQASSPGISPVTSGLLGAAAGYMMGRAHTPAQVAAPAPTIVHQPITVVKKTVVVQKNYLPPPPASRPSPSFSNPGPRPSFSSSRSYTSVRSGRR